MTAFVTDVASRGDGERQEWQLTVARMPSYVVPRGGQQPPVGDIAEDIRSALLRWLGVAP